MGVQGKEANKKIFLCSFATRDQKKTKNRFLNQALSLDIFGENGEGIYIYDEFDLDEKIKNFIKQASMHRPKTKGYNHGYFIWKPHIIKKTMEKIPRNSILLYADIGCFLNIMGKSTLNNYIVNCEKFSCLGFQFREPSKPILQKFNVKYQKYFEFNYTKKDVFDYFNISKNDKIYNSEQIAATSFLLKKNKVTKNFIEDWIDASTMQLLKTQLKNHENPELIQSSHDQSIFSILFKKYNFKSLCACEEVEWILNYDKTNNPKKYWDHLLFKPIQFKRLLVRNLNFWNKLKSYLYYKLLKFNIVKEKKRLL